MMYGIMNQLKSSISQKQYVFIFFRKLLVEDGGGAVGEEETDPMDRGQQVFWKTIWNFQKYLQIFISLEICPVWCTISTVSKTKLWKLFGIAETTQILY